jgi:ElaB/YqjD/DUF883 family membrane-anchored ribosome-binding protein
MGTTADDIRQQVDANRSSAEDKINKIEQQVTDQAQMLQDKVSDSAQMLQDKVSDTAQQVKEKIDWRRQVNDRPLAAVGVAMVGGMLLGKLTDKDNDRHYQYQSAQPGHVSHGPSGFQTAIRNAAEKSGLSGSFESAMSNIFSSISSRVEDMASGFTANDSGAGQTRASASTSRASDIPPMSTADGESMTGPGI